MRLSAAASAPRLLCNLRSWPSACLAHTLLSSPAPLSHPQVNLRTLNSLAKLLRRKRADRGALSLASPEVKFEIDTETHDPLDVGMYQVGGCLLVVLLLVAISSGMPASATCYPACMQWTQHTLQPHARMPPDMPASLPALNALWNLSSCPLLALQVREANQMVEEMMLLANCTGELGQSLAACWLACRLL